MKKRALIIGINNYLNFKDRQLNGCVNDTKIMGSVLEERFGFSKDDITFLRDQNATWDSIVRELKRILETCEPNEAIVFYFSGHGTRRRVDGPGISEGFEEAILTYDSGRGNNSDRYIRDSDFREWVALLVKQTQNIHLFFDCCHSGSMTREGKEIASGGRIRGIVTDGKREISLAPIKMSPGQHNYSGIFSSYSTGTSAANWLSLSNSYSLLTACRKDELAKEYLISKDGKSTYYGAFTHFLVQELNKLSHSTYQDVFEQLRITMISNSFDQTPQLEGVNARQLFSNVEIDTMKYVSVKERNEDRVTLSAGAVHGLTVNSKWTIHLPGTKNPLPENETGYIKIVNVGVVTTEAKILSEDDTRRITAGCRAVETMHYFEDQKKSVYIDSGLAELKRINEVIAKNIKASTWVRLADTMDETDFIVSLSKTGIGNNAEDKFQVEIFHTGNDQVLLKMPDLDRSDIVKIIENLEKLSRYLVISALENPSSKLNESVEFNLLQKVKGEWRKAGPAYKDLPQFIEGEQIAFQVINKSRDPLYISVLDMGLTKNIKVLFPKNADSERIGAKTTQNPQLGTFEIGTQNNGTITLSIPEGTFLNDFPVINKKGGIETFKLIVTNKDANFSFIEQAGVKTRGRFGMSIEEILYKYSSASRTREANAEIDEKADWLAINRVFYLFKS